MLQCRNKYFTLSDQGIHCILDSIDLKFEGWLTFSFFHANSDSEHAEFYRIVVWITNICYLSCNVDDLLLRPWPNHTSFLFFFFLIIDWWPVVISSASLIFAKTPAFCVDLILWIRLKFANVSSRKFSPLNVN